MERLIQLQEDIELKICQLKSHILEIEKTNISNENDIHTISDLKKKLSVLEKEFNYCINYNDVDIDNFLLLEWLNRYNHIINELLSETKILVA
ncbi:MAG: hypothetical protein ACOCRK_07555 [bacterium]